MKNADGKVIYVGKAKNLKKRISQYFGKIKDTRYQIHALMQNVADVESVTTKNEKEALLLEYKLIQEHRPKYNIEFKDNKSYVSVKISSSHKFPGIYITRKTSADRSTYFGPYTSTTAARDIVKLLIRHFKIRNCADTFFANRSRPCIQHEIGRCTAPCVGLVTEGAYKKQLMPAIMFLQGDIDGLIKKLENEMRGASQDEHFEKAANLRDAIDGIKKMIDRPAQEDVILSKTKDPLSMEDSSPSAQNDRNGWVAVATTLQRKLKLSEKPTTIECVDVSNISGMFAVGAMISFVNGLPEKSRYRRFKIRTEDSPDDYAMMREVLERRFSALSKKPLTNPDLLLIDGGKGHLQIAVKVIGALGLNIDLAAIAKGRDRKGADIFLPNRKNPIGFKKGEKALLFLIRVRDEAHRFGIKYYRERHRKELLGGHPERRLSF